MSYHTLGLPFLATKAHIYKKSTIIINVVLSTSIGYTNRMLQKIVVLNGGPKTYEAMSLGTNMPIQCYKSSKLLVLSDMRGVRIYYENKLIDLSNSFAFTRYDKNAQMCGIILEHIKRENGKIINEGTLAYKNATGKAAQIPRLSHAGLPIPKTLLAEREGINCNYEIIESELLFPLVLKIDGECGNNVQLCHNRSDLLQFALSVEIDDVITIQEYIPNTYDIRLVIAFGKSIGAIKRNGAENSFLNNIAKGGQAHVYTPSSAEIEIAKQALLVNLLDYGGVDIIHRSNFSPLVIEVNYGLGVNGFQSAHQDIKVFAEVAKLIKG